MSTTPHQGGNTLACKVAAPKSTSPTNSAKLATGNASQYKTSLPISITNAASAWAKSATADV